MAKSNTPKLPAFPYAIQSVKQGLSANEGLRQYRAAGGAIARQSWLRLRSTIAKSLGDITREAGANPAAIPNASEINTFPDSAFSGYLQQVEVAYRLKGTAEVNIRHFTVKTQQLLSRQDAIASALAAMAQAQAEGNYQEQVILGGTYTGTYVASGQTQ